MVGNQSAAVLLLLLLLVVAWLLSFERQVEGLRTLLWMLSLCLCELISVLVR